mmetsp:Transcript_107304/g.160500  ORF Transcript_107304/g.160500 Transcript_107304/m.160500 type:complete len:2227 (-) Transcript_107304:72-6752(-)
MSSSLYAAPILSSLSRDPSGVDPDGIDDANRQDPAGVHALESVAMAKKQAKMQKAAERLKNLDVATIRAAGSLKNLDVATLVGAPPPPPKTPPPKKNRRSHSRSRTPQPMSMDINLGDEHDAIEVEPVVSGITSDMTEFAGDTSTAGVTPRVLAPSSFESTDSMDVDDPAIQLLDDSTSLQTSDQPGAPTELNSRLSIAEERRRTALAMYQSDDLVLDHEEAMLAEQLLRPAMKMIENKPESPQVFMEKRAVPSPPSRDRSNMAVSPSSLSTRPHSNQTHSEENQYQQPSPREVSARDPSPRDVPVTQTPTSPGPVQASPAGKKQETRSRGFSIERKPKSDADASGNVEKESDKDKKGKKRGFFKKLFRGRGREQGSVASKESRGSNKSEPSANAPFDDTPITQPKADPPTPQAQLNISESPIQTKASPKKQVVSPKFANVVSKAAPAPTPKAAAPTPKPVLKPATQRQYQGAPFDDTVSEDPSQPDLFANNAFSAPSESLPPASSFGSSSEQDVVDIPPTDYQFDTPSYGDDEVSAFSTKTPRTISQDPPDDEHGDPPVRSGPPLLSPTSYFSHLSVSTSQEEEEQSRIESVRSRLAEVYEEHTIHEDHHEPIASVPSSLSRDQPDFFFNNNDEVSILSGPSFETLQKRSKSFDPVQASESVLSEPTGAAEPYVAPLFHASGPQATPAHLSHLRVHVAGQNADPAGESPMHFNSARGLPPSSFRDPVGESPVAWRKISHLNDPVGESPLHASSPVATMGIDPDNESPTAAKSEDSVMFAQPPQPRSTDELVPDPSLDLGPGYASDDSSFVPSMVEEKKEDDPRCEAAEPEKTETSEVEWKEDPSTATNASAEAAIESEADAPVVRSLAAEVAKEKEPIVVNDSPAMVKVEQARKKISMSKATRAALRLSKKTGKDAIRAQLDEIPTPKNQTPSNKTKSTPLGSTPLLTPSNANSTQPEPKDLPAKELFQAPKDDVPPRHDKATRSKVTKKADRAGFKSAPSTPADASRKDSLTVSTAAYTNAKAVAYLHQLHGEPSPRHSWHSAKKKKPEPSPVAKHQKARRERKKSRAKAKTRALRQAPSPSEYGAHNFSETTALSIDVHANVQGPEEDGEVTPKRSHVASASSSFKETHGRPTHGDAIEKPKQRTRENVTVTSKREKEPEKKFAAYNAKFHGRKPTKKKAKAPTPETLASPKTLKAARLAKSQQEAKHKKPPPIMIPGAISTMAVRRGILLRRNKRKDDIESGRSTPVVITPKPKPTGRNRFNFVPANEAEIKDPIQRAGRRLLSKAAVPIQSAARRYMAKRAAIDRMWALIEIQTCFRRWRCEAHLQACIHSAKIIQTAFRGWHARALVKNMQSSATQIQKIVRGYLAAAHVYDSIYYVIRIQALVRGCQTRTTNVKRDKAATTIQKYYRGHWTRVFLDACRGLTKFQALYRCYSARHQYIRDKYAASLIQATWRSYSARLSFQFEIVDIIIVQSTVRRWAARRQVAALRTAKHNAGATRIQSYCRGHVARVTHKKNVAAQRIQATWRGFQCYTDYIFSIVDILVVQRTMRQWLARRKVTSLREAKAAALKAKLEAEAAALKAKQEAEAAALKAKLDAEAAALRAEQEALRAKQEAEAAALKAQIEAKAATLLQSQWRRHEAQKTLLYSLVHIIITQSVVRRFLARDALKAARMERDRKRKAAAKIQAAWRGFWSFSHYIIVQYEVVKIQSQMRGVLARQKSSLKLGCAIIIQATLRQYLAKKRVDAIVQENAAVAAAAQELRERNACKRIQFWWRIVLDWTREKKAALTIERFFIHVRAEVDREIQELERKKSMKKEKRKKTKKKDADDKLLESVWHNTLDESGSAPSQARSEKGARRKSAPHSHLRDTKSTASGQGMLPHRTPTLGVNKFPSPMGGSACWAPIQQTDSSTTYTSLPTDAVRVNPSHDFSEVSNITNPTFNTVQKPVNRTMQPRGSNGMGHVLEESSSLEHASMYKGGESRKAREKRMTTDDYIKKYGPRTAPNRMPSDGQQQRHFFSEESTSGTPRQLRKSSSSNSSSHSQSHIHGSTPRSTRSSTGSAKVVLTPKGYHGHMPPSTPRSTTGNSLPSTPRSHGMPHHGAGNSLPSTPRGHGMPHHGAPSPRIPSGNRQGAYPPVTPTSRHMKSSGGNSISRRGTAETESQTTYSHSQSSSYARPSPRSYTDHRVSGAPVVVMKTVPNFTQSYSMEEAHEMLYLGDDYGEV